MIKNYYEKTYFKKRHDQKTNIFFDKPSFPKNCIVELTNACNHACIFCTSPKMKRKISYLSKDTFNNFITQAGSLGLEKVGFYATGEPFMVKGIDWSTNITKKTGIKRVYVTTNGALASLEKIEKLVDCGLDSIKFSINAATKESYKIIHGYDDFDKVLANVRSIREWKIKKNKKLQLLASFIYTDLTKKEISIFKEKYADLFEDVLYFPADNQGGNNQESHELYNNVTQDDLIKRNMDFVDSMCKMVFDRLHLTAEGFLTACCVDYENNLTYADFNKQNMSLADEWHNQIITGLRKKHISKKLDNLLCFTCMTGKQRPYEPISNLTGMKSQKNNKLKYLEDRLKIHNNKITEAI